MSPSDGDDIAGVEADTAEAIMAAARRVALAEEEWLHARTIVRESIGCYSTSGYPAACVRPTRRRAEPYPECWQVDDD